MDASGSKAHIPRYILTSRGLHNPYHISPEPVLPSRRQLKQGAMHWDGAIG